MPASVSEKFLELEAPILEPSGDFHTSLADLRPFAGYPEPRFTWDGRTERRQFREVALENDFLRATVLPELGPTVWSLFDKRTETELFGNRDRLTLTVSGDGCLAWKGELSVHLGDMRPSAAYAAAAYHIDRTHTGGDAPTVWVRTRSVRFGLSLDVAFAIAPDVCGLRVDYRVFNHSPLPIPFIAMSDIELDRVPDSPLSSFNLGHRATGVLFGGSRRGLVRWAGPSAPPSQDVAIAADRGGVRARFGGGAGEAIIGAHRLESWREWWLPVRGLSNIRAATDRGAIGLAPLGDGWRVEVSAARALTDHRLVVRPEGHPAQGMRVDLYPEAPYEIDLRRLPSKRVTVTIETKDGQEVLRAEHPPTLETSRVVVATAKDPETAGEWARAGLQREREGRLGRDEYQRAVAADPACDAGWNGLRRAAFWSLRVPPEADVLDTDARFLSALITVSDGREADEMLRAASYDSRWAAMASYMLSVSLVRRGEYLAAYEQLREALFHNACDVRAWILSSLCLRKLGKHEEAASERLNAHLLTPLEPLLRAEAFFSASGGDEDQAANLLTPLTGQTDMFLDVAEFLIEAGVYDDAVAWLTEASKLCGPNPMFHLLVAYCLSQRELMRPYVSEQIGMARRADMRFCFPWRRCEKAALEMALEHRPEDEAFRSLLDRLMAARRHR